MGSRGREETKTLKDNLYAQLDRLVQQLADLEGVKDEWDPQEYEETKKETLEQLREFQETIKKLSDGEVSLVDTVGSIQLAIQAAISEAFKTPEILRMFAKNEQGRLRQRLEDLEEKVRTGEASEREIQEKVEVLTALNKLKADLTSSQKRFLQAHDKFDQEFERAPDGSRLFTYQEPSSIK